jgi:hypothetical protein
VSVPLSCDHKPNAFLRDWTIPPNCGVLSDIVGRLPSGFLLKSGQNIKEFEVLVSRQRGAMLEKGASAVWYFERPYYRTYGFSE